MKAQLLSIVMLLVAVISIDAGVIRYDRSKTEKAGSCCGRNDDDSTMGRKHKKPNKKGGCCGNRSY